MPGTVCKAGRQYECRPGTYSDGTGGLSDSGVNHILLKRKKIAIHLIFGNLILLVSLLLLLMSECEFFLFLSPFFNQRM